jgi:general secretion pathway protein A
MYEQLFNSMGLREDPFHVSPDPRYYYRTSAHESALAELLYGIETRHGFLLLTGEPGTGKTSLVKQILDWLHQRGRSSAYIFHAHLKPIGLLRFILRDFGVSCQSESKSDLVNALHTWLLQRYAAQDLPVLIVDEAQDLPLETLDELRLLLNLETARGKLLQIILSGQPELEEKLHLPALRQLRQRIMFHSRLPVFTQKETAAYISSRLAAAGCSDSSFFPDEAVKEIYASSRGIPRVVNLLCEHALISAYAEQQRVVSPEMIQRIAVDFDLFAKPLTVTDPELQPHVVHPTPFPVIEKPAPPSVANQSFTAGLQSQIDFDLFNDPLPAVDEEDPSAVREHAVPAVPSPAPLEFSKPVARPAYASTLRESIEIPESWRWPRWHSALAVFASNHAESLQRGWHAFIPPFLSYARSVSHSFVHDCRLLIRALSLPTSETQDAGTVSKSAKAANVPSVFGKAVCLIGLPIAAALLLLGLISLRHHWQKAENSQKGNEMAAAQNQPGPSSKIFATPTSNPEPSPDHPAFVLRVGVMARKENANALAKSLRQMNYPAFVAKSPTRRLYRVLVGPYDSADAATEAKNELEKSGSRVIRTKWKATSQ